ncbi:MAG: ATP-binding protein, partial [Candidatus Binataceae bacterium]
DMSDIKKIQQELVAARDAAEAASRAKSEFLSSMSHEIRTPMNLILGMAELLAETELDPRQRQYLAMMRSNGSALLSLINDILDLAKVESGRLSLESTEFDLEALLNGVAETLALRAREKRLALTIAIAPEVPRALIGDSLRLRQVMINLVGNALKFTERGEVAINVTRESCADAGMLHFAVADTGIGIPADKLIDIFSSFTQADSSTARRFGGSGLGLAIVRRVVDLMGGRVWVESRLGVGSTFHFTARIKAQPGAAKPASILPAPSRISSAIVAPAKTAPPVEALSVSAAPALNILIADDSPDNRFLLRAFLKRQLYRFDEADNGRAALEKFKLGRPGLVLMDMQMPVMDGYTAVTLIREWESEQDLPRTPIIALTASALREDVDRCLAVGCDFHVSKPVSRVALLDAMRVAIASGAEPVPLEPALAAANPLD